MLAQQINCCNRDAVCPAPLQRPFVSSGARCELARRCFRWLEKVLGKTEPVVAAPAPP